VRDHFPDRIYAMPNYKSNSELQAPNIYHFKQDVSDLKDQDFASAALEIKNKKLTQELATTKEERERERERTIY